LFKDLYGFHDSILQVGKKKKKKWNLKVKLGFQHFIQNKEVNV
jgi:hypothetical protein